MDLRKVRAAEARELQQLKTGVKEFLRLATFYRRDISSFSDIIRPPTDLAMKDAFFVLMKGADEVFKLSNKCNSFSPFILNFIHLGPTAVYTDSLGCF